MQQGSVIREHRKLSPDVWCFRWWEAGPSGNRVHRRIVLGTAEQMRDAVSARQFTVGLVQEINTTDIRLAGISMTLAQLADHFHQRELGRSNGRISYSTKKAYQGYLNKSYKKECQEKDLPLGLVPKYFSRHSAPVIERALSIREWSSSGLLSCFVSACKAQKRSLSPVVPFHCRDGAIRFLKPTSLTVIH
jgi:hypothetical protein